MGYAVSWLAAPGNDSKSILEKLGLSATGELVDYGDELFTGRLLPSGWFVLFIDKCDHDFVESATLARLSAKSDVIACSIEEHVMWSSAQLWRNGAEVWRVEHDAQIGMRHLSVSGAMPEGYSAIEKELQRQQDEAAGEASDTDYYFEIPLEIAGNVVGFRHDDPGDDVRFEVYKATSSLGHSNAESKTKTWWKPWSK